MKKFAAVILSLTLIVLCGCSFAESTDITLIAGLEFGMDYNEAMIVSGYRNFEMSSSFLSDRSQFGITNANYLEGSGMIGGYDADIKVYFDTDNKLVQVVYELESSETTSFNDAKERPNINKEAYDAIEETLDSIYGAEKTDKNFPVSLPHGGR